jgi:fatty acid desaturase
MNSTHGTSVLQARAAVSAYIVLAGIWFLLAFSFLALFLSDHRPGTGGAVFVPLGVGMLWVGWLRGFRLDVGQENLSYRDGLYRTTVVPLREIRDVKNTWIEWRVLTRALRVPRLVISYGSKRN